MKGRREGRGRGKNKENNRREGKERSEREGNKLELDPGSQLFPILGVRHSHHLNIGYGWVLMQELLHFPRVHILTSADHLNPSSSNGLSTSSI